MKWPLFLRRRWLTPGGPYPYVRHAPLKRLSPWIVKALNVGWTVGYSTCFDHAGDDVLDLMIELSDEA